MLVVPFLELRKRGLTRYDIAGLPEDDNERARGCTRAEISEKVSALSDRFKQFYLADIDGLERNKPQLNVAQDICETLPTFYEGGVRVASNVIDMLITGADKCVIGTATLASLDDLRAAFKLSENITVKADFRDGIVSFDQDISRLSLLSLAQEVKGIGISQLFVPASLASEASEAKKSLGMSLGVFAPLTERSKLEQLGVDYLVARDFGGLGINE